MAQVDLFEAGASSRDALGEQFCLQHESAERRGHGITLTPDWLVDLMVRRLQRVEGIRTVVDAGAGSGRFSLAVAKAMPAVRVIAVENHPAMLQLLRQNIAEQGLNGRIDVVATDFRSFDSPHAGRTAFIGNPPFVRHHDIDSGWKAWYAAGMAARGIRASQLAGLHAHFVLKIAQCLWPGDHACLVAAAEWLDNGYGAALRQLLTGPAMPLTGLWLAPPEQPVFPDALVSAVVFEAAAPAASAAPVELGALRDGGLQTWRTLPLSELAALPRWAPVCQPSLRIGGVGIELGELFRVVRGQVTGANHVWVLTADEAEHLPGLTVPAVTRAREIIDGTVGHPQAHLLLRHVVNLPDDLDAIPAALRSRVELFLQRAEAAGAKAVYVARQRRHWHAVGMRQPPDAFVSYMGRRPPVFCTNPGAVSYLNIAHGLYARAPLAPRQLQALLAHVNTSTDLFSGRVYGGGLAKFEPSDVARLRVPAEVFGQDA